MCYIERIPCFSFCILASFISKQRRYILTSWLDGPPMRCKFSERLNMEVSKWQISWFKRKSSIHEYIISTKKNLRPEEQSRSRLYLPYVVIFCEIPSSSKWYFLIQISDCKWIYSMQLAYPLETMLVNQITENTIFLFIKNNCYLTCESYPWMIRLRMKDIIH